MTPEIFQIRFGKPAAHYERDPTGHPALHQSAQMGDQIHIRCPHCHIVAQRGPDKGHHCYVSLSLQVYRCMRCGDSGSFRFLLRHKTEAQIIEHRHRYKNTGGKSRPFQTRPNNVRAVAAQSKESSFRSGAGRTIPIKALPVSHVAWQYLLSEKFKKDELDDVLQVFHVYYCLKGRQVGKNPANTTEGRLIFEIRHREQIVGWQARWLPAVWPPPAEELQKCKDSGVQKYLLNPGFSKNAFPYNYDLAIKAEKVVAVEGIKKVWKTGPNAIGTFGIQFSLPPADPKEINGPQPPPIEAPWIQKLLYHKKILYILFDRGTEPEAEQTLEWYQKNGGHGKIIKLPQYGPDDLDQYTREEIKQLLTA
jgi:DNA-directed RNA polymerase subunit RPC12/RpoP